MSAANGKASATRWDKNAEVSVIGAVLLHNDALKRAPLAPSDFYDPRHREVWRAMVSLDQKGKAIDPVLLEAELGDRMAGIGFAYLSECVGSVPTADNVEFYVALVRDHAITRRVTAAASQLLHSGLEGPELLAKARDLIVQSGPIATTEDAPALVPAPTAAEVLRSAAFAKPQTTWSTGFARLDALIDGGIKARQLTALAASTGAGKTAFGCELARRLCMERPVLIVSTEIEIDEYAARVAGPLVNARASEILALHVSPLVAAQAVAGWPIHLLELDTDLAGVPDIAAHAERLRNDAGEAPIIIVDYLQHLAGSADDNALRGAVKRIATALRRMARAFDTAVIAISSVGRGFYGPGARKLLENEEDPRAWLAAAKESGDIEYSTAVFMFLETDSYIGPTGESHARLIVAKSRRGMHGFVGLRFHGPTGRFFDSDSAVAEMGPARKVADLERRIIAKVNDAKAPLTKNAVAFAMGGKRTVTLATIDRMVADEKLGQLEVVRPDSNGRKRKVKVITMPDVQGVLVTDSED